MKKLKGMLIRYRQALSYLFFGALTTLVNLGVYALLPRVTALSMGVVNAIANLVSILFAYATNRKWVFRSRTRGRDALREFGSFFSCRLFTFVLDMILVLLGLYVIGPRLFSGAQSGLLQQGLGALLTGGSDAELLKGQSAAWIYGVKLVSNVVVIVANYILSKVLVFKGPGGNAK